MLLSEHIYRRSSLRSDTFDAYDGLAARYPKSSGAINDEKQFDEYWTNGNTTHLTLVSSSSSSAAFQKMVGGEHMGHICSSSAANFDSSSIAGDGMMATSPGQKAGLTTSSAKTSNSGKATISKEGNIAIKSILSGSIAGITSTILFHPADVLRTKIQSSSFAASSSSSSGTTAAVATPIRPASVFMHTFRNGGFRALYTGISPVLGAQACYKACVFSVNNLTRKALIDHKTNERNKVGIFAPYTPTLFDTWFCGAMGGFINAISFVSPVEYVRNQQIAQHSRVSTAEGASSEAMKSKMKSPIDIIRQTLKRDGPFGLWRGTGVTVLRDSLGCGSFFVMYELGKRHLGPHLGGRDSTATMLASGAAAGWGFWAFALPLDTLKTLIQTGTATSAWDIVMLSIERDGFRRTACLLLRGWQLAFGRGGPAAAITLSTYATMYELTGKWLN